MHSSARSSTQEPVASNRFNRDRSTSSYISNHNRNNTAFRRTLRVEVFFSSNHAFQKKNMKKNMQRIVETRIADDNLRNLAAIATSRARAHTPIRLRTTRKIGFYESIFHVHARFSTKKFERFPIKPSACDFERVV